MIKGRWMGLCAYVLFVFIFLQPAGSCASHGDRKKQLAFTQNGYTILFRTNKETSHGDFKKLATVFFKVYPKLCNRFNKNAPQRTVVVPFSFKNTNTMGFSTNDFILLDTTNFLIKRDEIIETFCHELMHRVQQYKGEAEGWIKEGLADWGNYYYGQTTKAWRIDSFANTPRDGIFWHNGYQHTAKFFMWLDQQYPAFTDSLHKACLSGRYQGSVYFKQRTGKPVDRLWQNFLFDCKFTPRRPQQPNKRLD